MAHHLRLRARSGSGLLAAAGETRGQQFEKWAASDHAKAFAALATPEGKKLAAHKKIDDAQKSGECLICHTTAFGHEKEAIKEGFEPEAGVQCESCHGPGENHLKARSAAPTSREARADQRVEIPAREIIAKPLISTCIGCHNEKSPTFKPFCFKARNCDIKHLDPRKKRTPEELKDTECVCGHKCSCELVEGGSCVDAGRAEGTEAAGKKESKGAGEKKEE